MGSILVALILFSKVIFMLLILLWHILFPVLVIIAFIVVCRIIKRRKQRYTYYECYRVDNLIPDEL
jgi:hypothetical protein